jgi:UDPglucose 6-dehydrogenase
VSPKIKNLKIGIVGLGKLGLPLALVLSKKFNTLGYDISKKRIEKIRKKQFKKYKEKNLMNYLNNTSLKVTTDYKRLLDRDVIFCITNTPSAPIAFTNKYILKSVHKIKKYIDNCKLFVIVSTIMPNSHYTIRKQLKCPIAYNPEFIALGDVIKGMENPDFILIGEEDKKSGDLLSSIYKQISKSPIKRMDIVSAEICKMSLNSYITMKISFANLIGEIADKSGANANKICEALGYDKRIGKKYFVPGAMYQGPCFPRDNRALNYYFKKKNVKLNYFEMTDKINEHQLSRVIEKIKNKLKIIKNKHISIIGINYKEGTDETIESMGLKLFNLLKKYKAKPEIDKISKNSELVIYCMPNKKELFKTNKPIIDLWDNKNGKK